MALLAFGGVARFVVGACTGRWLHVRVRPRWWLIAPAVAAVVLLWVNQRAHAQLLMGNR